MVGRQLVIAVGDDQQRPGPVHPPTEERQQVQRRLIGPVGVLHHDDLPPLVQLVEARGEQLLPRAAGRQHGGEAAARLASQVVQRPERARGEERVARSDQEPGLGRVPLGESSDERGLADAGLARDKDDPAALGGVGQHIAHVVQQRRALQQLDHAATVRHRPWSVRV